MGEVGTVGFKESLFVWARKFLFPPLSFKKALSWSTEHYSMKGGNKSAVSGFAYQPPVAQLDGVMQERQQQRSSPWGHKALRSASWHWPPRWWMFGNPLGDAKFLIINPAHYKPVSSIIDPTVSSSSPQLTQLLQGRVGGGLGHSFSWGRMEIKPLAMCHRHPEGAIVQLLGTVVQLAYQFEFADSWRGRQRGVIL